MSSSIYMVASGDLRPSANQMCWPAQQAAEAALTQAIHQLGFNVRACASGDSRKGARIYR